MLYAILAYHAEEEVASWTRQEDAALMGNLNKIHNRLTQEGRLGPAARLGATQGACVLRGRGKGVVTDGPFTETKEQLLGFYVIDCADRDAAIASARELREVNPSAIYEIRPVLLYLPGAPFPETEQAAESNQREQGRDGGDAPRPG
ncbi:MAG: YciI family protein [Bradyrhizobium sp.]